MKIIELHLGNQAAGMYLATSGRDVPGPRIPMCGDPQQNSEDPDPSGQTRGHGQEL